MPKCKRGRLTDPSQPNRSKWDYFKRIARAHPINKDTTFVTHKPTPNIECSIATCAGKARRFVRVGRDGSDMAPRGVDDHLKMYHCCDGEPGSFFFNKP